MGLPIAKDTCKIHSGRCGSAFIVFTIPDNGVTTGCFMIIDQGSHQLSFDVVDIQPHRSSLWQVVRYGGAGIEGVGIVLMQDEFARLRCNWIIVCHPGFRAIFITAHIDAAVPNPPITCQVIRWQVQTRDIRSSGIHAGRVA